MNTKNIIPTIYQRLHEAFGVEWDNNLLITIGDTIYTKDSSILERRPDLLAHEKVHEIQQRKIGIDSWWNEYLSDPQFRLKQEIEAYYGQALFVKERIKDRNKRWPLLDEMCRNVSSPMYGSLISYKEALRILGLK